MQHCFDALDGLRDEHERGGDVMGAMNMPAGAAGASSESFESFESDMRARIALEASLALTWTSI